MPGAVSRYVAAIGLLLIIAGSAVYSVQSGAGGRVALVLLVAGAGLIAATALVNARELREWTRKRSARQGANAILMTLLFTAILVTVQAISVRNTHRHDLTRNQRFTLSESTRQLLAAVDDDVRVTAFYRRDTEQHARADRLLSLYAHESRRIHYELVDPDHKPLVAESMRAASGDMVVQYKDHRRVTNELTEQAITNTILFATRATKKAVYFVTGHDEKDIEDSGPAGYSALRMRLQDRGYLISSLSLLGAESVPRDCAVLVIAGPKKSYLAGEAERVAEYLAGGGKALFMIDPLRAAPEFVPILDRYRLALEDAVLLDELVVVDAGDEMFDATFTKVRRYQPHEITRGFRPITIFPLARPVGIVSAEVVDPSINVQYLAMTEPSVWGETDIDRVRSGQATRDTDDIQGSLAVAAVAERTNRFELPPKGAEPVRVSRIVVIGDSDFATNRFLGLLGNSDFLLNAIDFLAEEQDVIAIRSKEGPGEYVFITVRQGRLIFLLCLVLLPLAVMSTGVYVFAKKRRA